MRKANMDRRLRLDKQVMDSMQAHGVAGLFIDPENALVCLSSFLRDGARLFITHICLKKISRP
jgi:hypothetical protein